MILASALAAGLVGVGVIFGRPSIAQAAQAVVTSVSVSPTAGLTTIRFTIAAGDGVQILNPSFYSSPIAADSRIVTVENTGNSILTVGLTNVSPGQQVAMVVPSGGLQQFGFNIFVVALEAGAGTVTIR